MKSKKIFILLPDGISLRNFAFTSFVKIGESMGWDVIFWNHTPFDLQKLGYKEIKLKGKPRSKTDLLKRAKIEAELDHFSKKFNDPVYKTYKFSPSRKGLKNIIKNTLVTGLIKTHRGEKGLGSLTEKLKVSETKSSFYKSCRELLKKEKPHFVFCTNQRPVHALAPLTAAQDLGISTGTFIFSWDNLPKATMVIDTDHYFVWSKYMKEELLSYYPHIKTEQIFITGSPQFEPHFDSSLRQSREEFFKEHGLELARKYICFSGDDITTSPDDPQYLLDVSEAVRKLNLKGYNLGIIFRRCPVDFSPRYDRVLEIYKDLIVPVDPLWQKNGNHWNTVLPTREDLKLQANTILHSETVVNVGSSMVFDFAVFGKPGIYINYEVQEKINQDWSAGKIYKFVHFRSMPSEKAVFWLRSKEEIQHKLGLVLSGAPITVGEAREWFKKINQHPAEDASKRIWEKINSIVKD